MTIHMQQVQYRWGTLETLFHEMIVQSSLHVKSRKPLLNSSLNIYHHPEHANKCLPLNDYKKTIHQSTNESMQ